MCEGKKYVTLTEQNWLDMFKRTNSSGFEQSFENWRQLITRNQFKFCEEKFLPTDEIGRKYSSKFSKKKLSLISGKGFKKCFNQKKCLWKSSLCVIHSKCHDSKILLQQASLENRPERKKIEISQINFLYSSIYIYIFNVFICSFDLS
jgi:hypothetical protein